MLLLRVVSILAVLLATCAGNPAFAAEGLALPRVKPTEPRDAEATFRTLHGFRMELLAAEPLVTGPVAMEYDENGLAYVAEMIDYPYTDRSTDKPFVERTTDRPLGRIRVLEDVDGDGKFDRSTIFADELSWPAGLAFWNRGVYVLATPDVWYFKDTDGDRRADVRRKVFTGFRKFNVQAVINNLKWGLDHRIVGAGATNGGSIQNCDRTNEKPIHLSQQDFCFDPRREQFELLSGGARFGNSFDDWGNRFVCNIRNPVQHVVLPRHYLARNPLVPFAAAVHDAALAGDTLGVFRISPTEPWRAARAQRWAIESGLNGNPKYPASETVPDGYFTSASGVTVYRGAAYPPQFQGNVFVAEVAGNLVHRQTLSPDGVTFLARRADEGTEMVASTDNWFRPVNFTNAPDGTLHILDMYRETIEHPWSIPDDIKAQLDLESGRDRGRIYRLAPPGFNARALPRLGLAATSELVRQMENPSSWWRETAHRLLFERQDPNAEAPLRQLLVASKSTVARLHALWSLQGMGKLNADDVLLAMNDDSPRVREHGARLAEGLAGGSEPVKAKLFELVDDRDVKVRFQVAMSLGEVPDPLTAHGLAMIARRDAPDQWICAAVLSSSCQSATAVLNVLLDDSEFRAQPQSQALIHDLALVVGSRNVTVEVASSLGWATRCVKSGAHSAAFSVVLGIAQGARRGGRNLQALAAAMADSSVASLVKRMAIDADRTARDSRANLDERLRAVEMLACCEFATARPALESLVDAKQPHPLQLAVIRALAALGDPEVPQILLASYRGLTPGTRGEVVQALLARAEWAGSLIEAIKARVMAASDIPPLGQSRLISHVNDAVRRDAQRLFGGQSPHDRSEVLAAYRESLAAPGDSTRGQVVLARECLMCHRFGDRGHDVGPNLLSVRHRAAEEVLLHILDPNREVGPNFVDYVISRTDGRVATGIIASETATSITLRRAEGQEETIIRQDVEDITGSGRSLMPEGFEKRITPAEMADLLAALLKKD